MASDPTLARVADALAGLAPDAVRTGVAQIDPRHVATLFEVERDAVASAVGSRRSEFATGRDLLRSLIGHRVALPVGPSRAPVLPGHLVGSLAHDDSVVLGAVAAGGRYDAVGVDVEPAGPMTDDEAALVLRPDEERTDPRMAFVLKEAVYKAWSGLGGPMLEFRDVSVTVGDGTFRAQIHRPRRTVDRASSHPAHWVVTGGWALVDQRWIALVAVPAGSRPLEDVPGP